MDAANASQPATIANDELNLKIAADDDDEADPYNMESAPTEPVQTIHSVKKLGDWILQFYSGDGIDDVPPQFAEVYYFADRVKKYGGTSAWSYADGSDKTTIYFSPLIIRLKDGKRKQRRNPIYRSELRQKLGDSYGISYTVSRDRVLKPDATVNVLCINLFSKTFEKDGEEIKYFESKNFPGAKSDKLAQALIAKYHESEPIFERINPAKKSDPEAQDKEQATTNGFENDKL
jgi:hypothetical protein